MLHGIISFQDNCYKRKKDKQSVLREKHLCFECDYTFSGGFNSVLLKMYQNQIYINLIRYINDKKNTWLKKIISKIYIN